MTMLQECNNDVNETTSRLIDSAYSTLMNIHTYPDAMPVLRLPVLLPQTPSARSQTREQRRSRCGAGMRWTVHSGVSRGVEDCVDIVRTFVRS
jgi:hypothetical protein